MGRGQGQSCDTLFDPSPLQAAGSLPRKGVTTSCWWKEGDGPKHKLTFVPKLFSSRLRQRKGGRGSGEEADRMGLWRRG